jgi:hypothetical protein
MLLPDHPTAAHFLVAVETAQQRIVGAAMMAEARRTRLLCGPGIAIHVIEPCQGYGIETALCDGLAIRARQHGDEALYAAARVAFDSPEMRAWEYLGFQACETVEEHLLPLTGLESKLGPLVDWFQRHERIPSNARVAPLYQANRDQVLKLHLDYLGGNETALRHRLEPGHPEAFHPRYSRVLFVGDRVAGCVLGRRTTQKNAIVDAVIVASEWRGGWANAWLKLEATRSAMSQGVEYFQFTTFDHYRDTRSFTRHFAGTTTGKWALMMRPIS